jgi:hypothetical protein
MDLIALFRTYLDLTTDLREDQTHLDDYLMSDWPANSAGLDYVGMNYGVVLMGRTACY